LLLDVHKGVFVFGLKLAQDCKLLRGKTVAVAPSFIRAILLSGSDGDCHSSFGIFFLRVMSKRRTSSSVASSTPSSARSRL